MTAIVIAVAAKVSGYLLAPIGSQLSYLFCYRSYTDGLLDKVQKLGKARDDVQITVDEARRRGDEIRPIVQEWLNRVDEIIGEAEEFKKDENKSCFNGWCPNLKSRYQLSREADKKAQVIVEIQEHRNFPDGVSYRVPPRNVSFKNYEPFESRASTVNKVMDALRDDEINKIGVWGMGGVGKTTLVKQVAQLAEDEKLFTARVYIDVSWTRDSEKLQEGIAKIQQKIADMLGLEFKGKDESTRAVELKQRLQKEKILIILDDIWMEVSLEEVGIPSQDDQKGCKIVLASRNEDLLRKDMGAKECFPLQHLPKEEAWHLFKKTAGDSVEGDKLRPIAIEVVNECEGLPIAIVTIANALKDESVDVWENALDELRSSAPTNIRGVDDKVYGCLKWSYNHLKGDEVKSLFLLCGSLSYGDISMDHLLQYAMGLDLFDHIKSLEQARNKLVTLVRTLKTSSLLLDGEDHRHNSRGASRLLFMDADNKFVRMHDVVRDVARNIASKDPHPFVVREDVPLEEWSETDESKYISLNCKDVHELPHRLECPKLQFFLLQNNSPSLNIPNTFFEGMNLLKVLDVSKMLFAPLPPSLQSLANLRTLCLDRCELGDIALIGELKKLHVLSMVGSNIQQLPSEMGQLTNLRLLDLNDCKELKVIPRNILSSLSRLECLFMKSSFSQWAIEGVSDGESNACLSELNHLRHLTTIEIEVPAIKLLPREDMLFQNLKRYAIFIGNFYWFKKNYKTSKTLKLTEVDGSLLLRHGIGKLLKKTEELKLSELEEVFCGPIPPRPLDDLKTLDVEKCHGLKFLLLLCTARGLSQLEEMKIEDCKAMQQIIIYERESEIKEDDHAGTNLQLFPKLRSLKLRDLPELMNFDYFGSELETTSQGMRSQGNLNIHIPFFSYQVSFRNLDMLELNDLPKLKKIWHHQPSIESFYNLEILRVFNCPCLLNLIPSYLIQRFNNLKKIDIYDCEVLEHIFDLQGLDGNVEILQKLETLELERLPRLRYIICNEDKNDGMRCLFSSPILMDFQNLKCLSIKDCVNEDKEEGYVNTLIEDIVLFGEKVSFSNLEKLKLNGLPKLKMIWHHQLSLEFFSKLQILRVCNCPRLVNLVPSNLIQSFRNLKEVDVCNCEVLECVFDHRGLNGDVGILPKIEILKLEQLPRLRLIICNEDKNDNMRYLLFPSKFKDFHHLKELRIINCGMLIDEKFSLPPNLEVVVLKCLPKLKKIHVGILQKLKILRLEILPKLRHIICNEDKNATKSCLLPPSMFKNFHILKELYIIDCGIKDERDVYTPMNDVVLSNEKVSSPDGVSYEAFESRASTLNKIMDALRDGEINLIGVWGMGGVGKTTLVKQVAQQAKQQHLFTTQVYMDVSWTRDSDRLQQGIAKIQQQIAEMLGFQFWWKDETSRADELNQRLKKEKILIILDDIWKEIDLEEVGIPCKDDEKECKIVMTSRDGDLLCKDMGSQICFPVEHLPSEEAWSLLKKTAGDSVEENLEVQPIAMEVVEECEGLPMTIVTIAKALKDETVAVWKNALEQLRSCAPTNVRVDEKVYLCLGWSYDHLKGNDVKSLLLLCGMLGYGDISLDLLLQHCMGLDLFDHMESLEQATNKLFTLVKILKASCWLLEGHEDFVRMHDVVYDVARKIASKDPHPFVVKDDVGLEEWSETDESKRCTFISLNCKAMHELPQGLVCPNLQFFLLHNNNPSLNIPNTFFEGMKKLKVLDLSHMHFTTLPSSLDSLANLRTLRLDECKLVDIALIGKLTKLEVLSLMGSTIQQLPNEMVQLTNLRLLDLDYCEKLKVIPRNILSSLSRLECLYMISGFTQWAVEGESNACLSELNHLSYLTTLSIEIPDAKLLPKDIPFENLTRYVIFIGDDWWEFRTKRALKLQTVNRSLHLGDGISKLLERSEELEFMKLSGTKYVLYPSNRESFLELKHLQVSDSPEIQYIIDSKDQQFLQHGAFSLLESLVLKRLNNLEEVWHGPIPIGSFGNLKTLHVTFCGGLKSLFLLSTARGLSQLEAMTIKYCNAMQQIIAYERESEIKENGHDGTNLQLFPKLRSLELYRLPQLINFSSELEMISFTSLSTNARSEGSFFSHKVSVPKLEELTLKDLPKFKNIWHHQLPFGSFCNLRILRVYKCPCLLNLVPFQLIHNFQNLKEIDVQNCELLEHVIILQGIDGDVEILPKLETLKLQDLPRLRWIEDRNDSMKYICSPLILMNVQNLKELQITNCRMEDMRKI
ncbi:hypothetical protein PVL29_018450 [Vitis rotundifolia]|uniref:AAA+ ATPase domain-containing protein n=1 Tax=Vitis rotundifolia TaxID=103349 RepID=A0AA38Z521_VITRO|nr:hypothetical protein PVL29_018450 [Vitis rotundifolia]